MKKITIAMTLIASLIGVNSLQAQNKNNQKEKIETIVINGDEGKSQTTIEIKDGEVFIDGKKVADDSKDRDGNVKIIKKKVIVNGQELKDEDIDMEAFVFPNDGMDMQQQKPMLGVTTKTSDKESGAWVESVVPGSPAEKLGLMEGDIITKVNDRNISSPRDLVEAIGEYKPGDQIDITYERNSNEFTKNVKLSERKDRIVMNGTMPFNEEEIMRNMAPMMRSFQWEGPGSVPNRAPAPKIGVSAEDRADGDGVLVSDLTPGSAAEKAGILKNDVIVLFGSKTIENVDELMEAIANNQNKNSVAVEVKRNGVVKQLTLTMPKNLKKKDL
ncbi:MAG: PDZ domain-containing protein [Chitinophagaceae bacterium]|nr:PDZ domain-containing protein [Chitinophagaceae bacterium]